MTLRKTATRPGARWALLALTVTALLFVSGALALAVHDDGTFELDRNATNDGVAGEDWEDVFNGDDTAGASTFKADGRGPTIFTGGGSKDDLDTGNWKHKDGSTPDKDELLNAYAARYGDVIYFGADRYAGNGDAQMGFWFFQEEVGPQTGGTFGPGQHTDGDVLVLSNFTNGGGVTNIRVFIWNGPGGDLAGSGAINGTLDLIGGSESPADCVGPPAVGANDPFCATVNTTNQDSPWTFEPKNNPAGTFPPGQFYEGGIDLSNPIFGSLGDECFASFLAETRSSTSVDATLKDFVADSFEPCDAMMTTTPSDDEGNPLSSITLGDSIYDSALIQGTGSTATPTGTVDFYLCSPSQLTTDPDTMDETCATGGTLITEDAPVSAHATITAAGVAMSTAATPTSTGTWCWRGVYSGDGNYPEASDSSTGECFTVNKIQPTINTTPRQSGNVVTQIVLGESITDHALLTGTAAGGPPTGTVTFFVCSPSQLTPPTTGTCSTGGTQLGSAVPLVAIASTNTSQATSASTTPNVIGRWCFRGVYSGDEDYLNATDSDSSECFQVVQAPTAMTTAQSVIPNDSATISATVGGDITGTVTFRLYDSLANCQEAGATGLLYAEPVINITDDNDDVMGADTETVTTTNTATAVSADATVFWRVDFVSTNAAQKNRSSVCSESTTIDFANDAGPGAEPTPTPTP